MELKKVGLWGMQIAAAAMLIMPAWGKLVGAEQSIAGFSALGMEPTGRIIIGILEMLTVLLLLLPRVSASGAFLGMGIMIGAIIAHLTFFGMLTSLNAIIIFVLCAAIAYLRREDLPLIGRTL